MSNYSGNSSQVQSKQKSFASVYHSLLLLIAVLIIIENTIVLYLFMKNRVLKYSVTNRLLANLALSDLITGTLMIPMTIASASLRTPTNILYFISYVVAKFCTIYSVFSVSIITFDRYMLICQPYSDYSQTTRYPKIWHIILIMWSTAMFAALPITWLYDVILDPKEPTKRHQIKADQIYDITTAIVFFLVPSCFVIIALILMYKEVRTSMKREKKDTIHVMTPNNAYLAVVIRFFYAFLAFLVCWVPLTAITTWDALQLYAFVNGKILEVLFALRCMTSLINPILYTWRDKDYKKALAKSHFYKALCACTRSEEIEEGTDRVVSI
eukprot:Seg25.7 transcript_id=Seg25.7/GoldUCD/mRNA.D3Y31 product="Neuropeptide Y receptor type 1" protein_id=Seg25.7/GoldUCD/D3Y31